MRAVVAAVAVVVAIGSSCATTSTRARGLSMKEAVTIVAEFESTQASAVIEPIAAPTTMEEATAILKRDRLDAFKLVVAFLDARKAVPDRDPAVVLQDLALSAQVQLAWGEAELLIAEVLNRTANALESEVVTAILADPQATTRGSVLAARARIATWRRTDEALRLLAVEHIDGGARDADAVVAMAVDDYLGYRIGADAARLTNNWSRFEALVAKVEQVRPDSNGLRFLRGVQAWSQQADADVATFELRAAVDADPQFIRALAWLLVISPTGAGQRAALDELEDASPDHQLVRFAGPGILATTPSSPSAVPPSPPSSPTASMN